MVTPTNDGIDLICCIILGLTDILVLSKDLGKLSKANPDLVQSTGNPRSAVHPLNSRLQGLGTLVREYGRLAHSQGLEKPEPLLATLFAENVLSDLSFSLIPLFFILLMH